MVVLHSRDEAAQGKVVLKNLKTGAQETCEESAVVVAVEKVLALNRVN